MATVVAIVIAVLALLLQACGERGTAGASAYDIWIGLGNRGSEQDFMDALRGRTGAPGRDGVDGVNGISGSGSAGATGATGAMGALGLTGAQGDSAYRIWLLLGNAGTEQDFIDSLRGATGAQGPVGATGATGAAGVQGPVGMPGAPGATGATGSAGPTGATGATGETGAAGPPGPSGPPGADGATGPAGPVGFGDVGDFWDETTQGDANLNPGFLADTAYAMTFDHSDTANNRGISIVSGSQISFTNPGLYNIQFSAQVTRSQGGSATDLTIWLRVNGIDVPWTATDFTLQSNSLRLVTAWNFYVPVTCAGGVCDHYELMWSSQSRYTGLVAIGPQTAPDRPAIPSIILTVGQVH